MRPEPLSLTPPAAVRHAVFTQHWRDLTMLHWPVDPSRVAPLLPPGVEPDVHEGVSYVGLVPFVMAGVRILGAPPLPHLSGFAETNVRLYGVDGLGRRGVVFRSLEAARLLPVVAARVTYHLPYVWARMAVRHGPDTVAYESSRRWPGPRGAGALIRIRKGAAIGTDELASFLTSRWGLFSDWYGGRTAYAPVDHVAWPLHAATLLDLSENLVVAAGLPEPAGAPHVLWSPGVRVRIGRPRLLEL